MWTYFEFCLIFFISLLLCFFYQVICLGWGSCCCFRFGCDLVFTLVYWHEAGTFLYGCVYTLYCTGTHEASHTYRTGTGTHVHINFLSRVFFDSPLTCAHINIHIIHSRCTGNCHIHVRCDMNVLIYLHIYYYSCSYYYYKNNTCTRYMTCAPMCAHMSWCVEWLECRVACVYVMRCIINPFYLCTTVPQMYNKIFSLLTSCGVVHHARTLTHLSTNNGIHLLLHTIFNQIQQCRV